MRRKLKEDKRLTFYSGSNRYETTFYTWLVFAAIFGFIVVGATLGDPHNIIILWIVYLGLFGFAFLTMFKSWPKCPNDGKHLRVADRLQTDFELCLVWRCPKCGREAVSPPFVPMGKGWISSRGLIELGRKGKLKSKHKD